MKWKGYPKYKESGVDWLGPVPGHWEIKRLDFLASVKARLGWKGLTASEYVDDGYVFLATPNIKGEKGINFENVNFISEERYLESPEIMLQKDDVLIAKDGSTLGITNIVRELPRPATVNSSIAVIRSNGRINGYYLFRWICGYFMQAKIESFKDGQGVPHLFQADIRKFPVLLPEASEQTAIANFLDRETGRLDTLIAKKQALSGLLKEKRTALISQTVTRGLPPDAAREFGLAPHTRFKDSGEKWIGDIPFAWEIKPVKSIAHVGNGSTPNRDNPLFWEDGDFPWLNSSVVNLEEVVQADQFVTKDALSNCHLPVIEPPAVLIGITGQGKTRGLATTLLIKATINQHIAFVKPIRNSYGIGYLRRVFDMAYLFLRNESDGGGSTKGAITCEQIKSLRIPFPLIAEQTAIATYLDRETKKLDTLITKIETAITRLQEYRTALITAAVTGKIDVRDHASKKEAA
ncbi:MAG: restriction endonuclease subunit S [Desulfobacteraceae bacterium]|nr:restriction endonuclease subunit S [Desulfobacteraceae bacterium]